MLNKEQIKHLPDKIKNALDDSTFNHSIERNCGIIPLIPLIGANAEGNSAIALAGEATASAIISATNSAKRELHHRELENIANG